MTNPKRILSDKFQGGDRGPVLKEILLNSNNPSLIKKILFEGNSFVEFTGPQTFMITPHEVYGGDYYDGGDGIYDMGKSDWFNSMDTDHLEKCSHYRLFFYDEIVDVICENLVVENI